jgi:hypothetical protein
MSRSQESAQIVATLSRQFPCAGGIAFTTQFTELQIVATVSQQLGSPR